MGHQAYDARTPRTSKEKVKENRGRQGINSLLQCYKKGSEWKEKGSIKNDIAKIS